MFHWLVCCVIKAASWKLLIEVRWKLNGFMRVSTLLDNSVFDAWCKMRSFKSSERSDSFLNETTKIKQVEVLKKNSACCATINQKAAVDIRQQHVVMYLVLELGGYLFGFNTFSLPRMPFNNPQTKGVWPNYCQSKVAAKRAEPPSFLNNSFCC